MRRSLAAAGVAGLALFAAGCQTDTPSSRSAPTPRASVVTTTPAAAPTPSPHPRKKKHSRIERVGATPLPAAFTYRTAAATSAQLGKSWHKGCPVAPTSLAAVTMTYWGFDRSTHHGTLIVNRAVVTPVVAAFRSMYAARFPIRRLQPIAAYRGDDDASMAADNTSAFNCRLAVSDGPPSWSMHAYGEAIDIDPLENPYRLDGKVLPPAGAPYMDRSNVRPGMVVGGSAPVAAFGSVRWGWGGNWSSTPDYQHFSVNGR